MAFWRALGRLCTGKKQSLASQTLLFWLRSNAPLAMPHGRNSSHMPDTAHTLAQPGHPPGRAYCQGSPDGSAVGRVASYGGAREAPIQDISHDARTPIPPPRRRPAHVCPKPNTTASSASASRWERQPPGSRAARRYRLHVTIDGPFDMLSARAPAGRCV